MAVSITDVAQAAGVSASTVSRALRGREGVSDEVRAQIVHIATSLGYTASRSAASLASGRTHTVGLIAPYVGRWFFGRVIDAAEKELSAAGYDLLLYNLGSDEARHRFFSQMPARKRVDALISLVIPTPQETEILRSLGIPLATVVGNPLRGFISVGIDDRDGARAAVRLLINHGHTRIGLIGTGPSAPLGWTAPLDRRQAYLDVLADAGIAFDPRLEANGEYTFEGGERAMTQLLSSDRPPTAVFAQSDEMAMGALRALRRQRLRVPEDISIIGFDDHELAEVVGLTTVAQPVTEQGTKAAQLLLEQLASPGRPLPEPVQMPIRLQLRETVGPPQDRSTPNAT